MTRFILSLVFIAGSTVALGLSETMRGGPVLPEGIGHGAPSLAAAPEMAH